MMTFLEKLAQFQDYNEMKEYYDNLVERAYRIGVMPRFDTNWEDIVESTMNLEGRDLQKALEQYKMSNNRKQMYDSLMRTIGNKEIELGGMSLENEAEKSRRELEQSAIDDYRKELTDKGLSVDHMRRKPYGPYAGAKTMFLGRIKYRMGDILKGLQDGTINQNFPLENYGFSSTMTTGRPHSVSVSNIPLWKNFSNETDIQTHTHPEFDGLRYKRYRLNKMLKDTLGTPLKKFKSP